MAGRGGRGFIDTNVLVYLLSADGRKAAAVEAIVRRGGTISVQVLNEVGNLARRKMGTDWAELRGVLESLRGLLDVVPVTVGVHARGLAVAERYVLSFYDAMIVGAALEVGCGTLWSEDMQDGLVIEGGLVVVNPFGVGA